MKTIFDNSRMARAYAWMQNKTDLDADSLTDLLMDLRVHCATHGIPFRSCERIVDDIIEGNVP